MAGIQAGGIGSGLDINSLVTQLVTAEGQVRANRINKQETAAQAELSAIGTLKGTLSEFQNSISVLRSASQLGGRIANNTINDYYTVSVGENAPKGAYAVEVKKLAAAHKVASAGFASKTTTVGSGTLTFQFGTYDSDGNTFTLNSEKATKTVAISPANSSVQAIRDAVNNANIGVTASLVNNGTTETLVFSSSSLGAKNSLKISVTDDDGNNTNNSGLSQLAFDPTAVAGSGKNLTQAQAGIDAHLVIDGVDVYKQTNTITDAIEGVTMHLKKISDGALTTTTVDLHSANAKAKVANFVKSFNTLTTALKDLTGYDPATKKAGVLNGDATTRGLQGQVRSIISEVVKGLDGKYRALADIGIKTNSNGTLSLDSTKLDAAVENDFLAIGRLFAPAGTTSDEQVHFSAYTEDSTIGEYTVNITQMPTQGKSEGSSAANLTITTDVNDTLVVALDGQTATIKLSGGVYTATSLAAEVQSRINGATKFSDNNISANVTQSGGVMTIQSNQYGSSSTIQISGGNGKNDFMGLTPTTTAGVNVEGTINGHSATGKGEFLTGTGIASGIKLEVTGGSTGDRGTINFTRGVADKISMVLETYLGDDNVLDDRTKMINTRLKSISSQRDMVNQRLESFKKRLVAQFTALDKLLGSLRTTSDFLAGQLDKLPGPKTD